MIGDTIKRGEAFNVLTSMKANRIYSVIILMGCAELGRLKDELSGVEVVPEFQEPPKLLALKACEQFQAPVKLPLERVSNAPFYVTANPKNRRKHWLR